MAIIQWITEVEKPVEEVKAPEPEKVEEVKATEKAETPKKKSTKKK